MEVEYFEEIERLVKADTATALNAEEQRWKLLHRYTDAATTVTDRILMSVYGVIIMDND